MSRFEETLVHNLNSCSNRTDLWCSKLAWAAYQARTGKIAPARDSLIEVREESSRNICARVYSRLNLVEGLCEFFSTGVDAALPKFLRARAIAVGCAKEDPVYSLANVWLASLYKNKGEWDQVLSSLIAAKTNNLSAEREVGFRLCLILGDLYQETENYEQAAKWYSGARNHALEVGDEAALSAMLYNRAAIRVYNLRLRCIADDVPEIDDAYAALEEASAHNYTQYIDDQSLRWGFDLMRGQLALVRNDMLSALRYLSAEEVRSAIGAWPEVNALCQADILRCRVATGWSLSESPIHVAQSLIERLSSIRSPGDRAIVAHSIGIGLQSISPERSVELLGFAQKERLLLMQDRAKEREIADQFVAEHGSEEWLIK